MIVGIAMQQPSSMAGPPPPPAEYNEGSDAAAVYVPEETGYVPESYMDGASAEPQYAHHNHHIMQHPAMVGLQQQFQQFGLQQHLQQEGGGSDHVGNSVHNDSSENNTNSDGNEDSEDDPVKLFVGQVPKLLNEEDIFPTFDSFGPLKDVAVIRDKHTGIHRGCAFVTYWSSADAERAREALHDKFTFPGSKRAAQVKPAEPSAVSENKLFVGMLSRKAEEEEVRDLFTPFGEIREIYMIRNPDGSSKCAAFLRFMNRESAVLAIEQLNGNQVMEGAARPLIVKFADNKHQRQQRHMRSVRRQEIMAMVGPHGYPYQAPVHQGPPMGMHPGSGPQYAMPPPQYATAYGPGADAPPPHPYMYHPQAYGPPPYDYPQQQQVVASRPQEVRQANPRPREGPAGANLFVYHLPHDLTDADLATAFNPFGNVISAKVYVDKYTGESKGFGFVSYDSVIAAEQAIEQMNGFQIGSKRLKVQHKRVHGSAFNSIDTQEQQPQSPPLSGNGEVPATG